MRWLGILAILAYRIVIRPFLRRRCLYPESCSAFGIRACRERGLFPAIPIIRERIASCRLPDGACFILGADGKARLLEVERSTHQMPPLALAFLAEEAERATAESRR